MMLGKPLKLISLRFQAIFFLLLSFLAVVFLISFFTLKHMEQNFSDEQLKKHKQYQQHFHYLIDMDVEHLAHLSEEILLGEHLHASAKSFYRDLQANWPDLHLSDHLEGLSLFDQINTRPLLTLGNPYPFYREQRLLADIALETQKTQSQISCHRQCLVMVAVPKRYKDTLIVILMYQKLSDSINDLSSFSELEIALLGGTALKTGIEYFLTKWNLYLLTTGNFTSLFQQAAQSSSLQDLTQSGIILEHQDQIFMLWGFLVTPNMDKNAHYVVFIENTTENINEIRKHFYTTLMFIFAGTLILGFVIFTLSIRPLRRIRRLANLLPQLSQQNFKVIPETLNNESKHFIDEIDILEQSSIDLSDQLEKFDAEIKEKTKALERAAMFDDLTGLANRSMFMYQLHQSIAQISRQSNILGLVFIDLDKFKVINDTLGHDLGDELLKNVANRLNKSVRETDLVCRLGGDEFVVILNNLQHAEDAKHIMNKMMTHMNRTMRLGDYNIQITFSAGVAFAFDDQQSSEELLKNADIAMYEAKCKGRNGYEIFNQAMRDETSRKFIIENSFHNALESEQLSLQLLPKKRIGTSSVIGLEAICIWKHPTEGLIKSDEFLPIIEQNTLFVEYSQWLIRRILRLLEHLEQAGMSKLHVSFNIPAKQFTNPLLFQQLNDCFSIYDGYQKRVDIEIRESVLLKDFSQAKQTMESLKKMGFSLTMDHFGSGHASLASLSRLPFDYVKLDREFVKRLDESPTEAQIIDAMIKMSHQLQLEVIADAVENEKQYQVLQKCQCDYAQGPFISSIIEEDEISEKINPETLTLT